MGDEISIDLICFGKYTDDLGVASDTDGVDDNNGKLAWSQANTKACL